MESVEAIYVTLEEAESTFSWRNQQKTGKKANFLRFLVKTAKNSNNWVKNSKKISFFTCFLLILSRKSALSWLKSNINCFNRLQNDWCGLTKSNNVKSLVKKDEKLTKIEFFKMFMISTRILGANKFSLTYVSKMRKEMIILSLMSWFWSWFPRKRTRRWGRFKKLNKRRIFMEI